MKKFTHLYDNVIDWNDSAGEEAFSNAKKRYWANKNGVSCNISLPDPDLYIDNINWDSSNDPDMLLSDVESLPMSPKTEEDHDPVVIFGDSASPDQFSATVGWGDEEENLVTPATCSSANYANPWNEWAPSAWPGYTNDGWQTYSNDVWRYNDGSGHGCVPWEGDWSNWNWNYANNCYNYVGSDVRDVWGDGDPSNVPTAGSGGCASSYNASRVEANEQQRRKHMPRNGEQHDKATYKRSSAGEWNPNSITVGRTWDRE